MTRLVQITDLHLGDDPDFRLHGVAVWPRLQRVLARARQLTPDLLLLSGDLSHDAGPEAFAWLDRALAGFPCPVALIPGNHDDTALLRARFPAERADAAWRGEWTLPGLRLLTLDSSRPGQVEGALELEALAAQLEAGADVPTLIALHHPPVPVGAAWVAALGLRQPEAFWALLQRHPQVRGVLCGHAHQGYDAPYRFGGLAGARAVRVLCTPASSVQFDPGRPEFALAQALPGLRWLDFENGQIRATAIERIHPQLQALVVPNLELRSRLEALRLPIVGAGADACLEPGEVWSLAGPDARFGAQHCERFEAWLVARGVRVLELRCDPEPGVAARVAEGLISLLTGVAGGMGPGMGANGG